MSKLYKVTVNDNFEFDIDEQELLKLDAVATNASQFHVLHDKKPFVAEVTSNDFLQKKYTVNINNNRYEISIQNPLDELIKAMGFELGASKMINDIKAPMPGLILDVAVVEGQEVEENETLLILEAMKMENVLTSPRHGIIRSIAITKGDAVEKNQLLIEFEA